PPPVTPAHYCYALLPYTTLFRSFLILVVGIHAHLPVKTPIQVGRRSLYHSVRFFTRGTVLTHNASDRAPRTSSVIVNELPVLLAGDILVRHMPEPVRVRAADRHTGFKVVGQPTKFVPLHVSHLAQNSTVTSGRKQALTQSRENTPPLYRLKYTPP